MIEEFDFFVEQWMKENVNQISEDQLNEPETDYGVHNYSFEKLIVWNKAIDLVKWIYEVTANFPGEEKFILTSQIRRSAISISSNIAEGSGRRTTKDKSHFLNIAYSSAIELLNQVIIALRLQFISETQEADARQKIQEITAMIYRLQKSLKNS